MWRVAFVSKLSAVALLAGIAPTSVIAQNAPEGRNFCSHATSASGAYCPSLGPSVKSRMARIDVQRERAELRAPIKAALAEGRCEDARRIAVDKGLHELAARIRRACSPSA